MSGTVEYAAGDRSGDFPARWGTPPGTPSSEERAAWVRRHTLLEQARNLDPALIAHRALVVSRDAPADAQLALAAAKALGLLGLR